MSWSCHVLPRQPQDLNENDLGTGQYAPLDVAYGQSPSMSEFQNRLTSRNPLTSQDTGIFDGSQFISPRSEERLNSNADEMVGSFYGKYTLPPGLQQPTVENFGPDYIWDKGNKSLYQVSGVSGSTVTKWIVGIVVVIIILILLYLLYQYMTKRKATIEIQKGGDADIDPLFEKIMKALK